jgi:hypothetical protein
LVDLYLDHNVSLHLVPVLRAAGHDVLTARDQGHARLTNDAQLLEAIKLRRVLVTHNRKDFVLLYDAWTTWPGAFNLLLPRLPGVVVLEPAPLSTLSRTFIDLLAGSAPDLRNQLVWWRGSGGWQRHLVGGRWEPFPPVG